MKDRETDGKRIAELLSSEVHGRSSGQLADLAVAEADRDVEPSEFGAFAYGVDLGGERLADAYVHPDRAHLEFRQAPDVAAAASADADLRTRPEAVAPPRTLVFVESGAEVKRAVDVLVAVADSVASGSE